MDAKENHWTRLISPRLSKSQSERNAHPFSVEDVKRLFHIDKESIEPNDVIISWDTIQIAEDLVLQNNTRNCPDHVFDIPTHRYSSLMELVNFLEAATIFNRLIVPTRNIGAFNTAYFRNGITTYLVDKGILKVTNIDDIYATHPQIVDIQSDMYATLFEPNDVDDDSSNVMKIMGSMLHDSWIWDQVIFGIETYGYSWAETEYFDSHGWNGDYGWIEEAYSNAILLYSTAQVLGTSYQPNIVNYPLKDILMWNSHNYKLPEAYKQLVQTVRRKSYGKLGLDANLAIPPISSYILTSSTNMKDIIKKTETIRNKFTSFRERFREYQYVLDNQDDYNPDILEKMKNEYWGKLMSDIESIGTRRGSFLHVFEPYNITVKVPPDTSVEFSLSLFEFAEMIRRGFDFISFKSQPRLLTNMYKSTMSFPRKKQILKILGIDPNNQELRKFVRGYEQHVKNSYKHSSYLFPSVH